MKKVGVISYAANHLKTEQLVLNLLERYQICIYALPFVPRPARKVLFQHRPDQTAAAHPKELCQHFGLDYVPVTSDLEIDNGCDYYLVAGAGILSGECLQGKRVLNGHPGIIPAVRGLDAFKWSIYNILPLGVTLHYIDENVDLGKIVSVVQTPVFLSDTLETVARRHYENEIKLLSNFEQYLFAPQNPFPNIPCRESERRMKYEQEISLMDKFELYKQKYARAEMTKVCAYRGQNEQKCPGGGGQFFL